MIHDIGKKECSNLAGTNVANYTCFVFNDSTGSLILYSLIIKSNYVLYLTIYNIPFLLSTCFRENEKQAGAELGKAGNKLNRASHIRCWSYLVSSVVRIWINNDFCEANSF